MRIEIPKCKRCFCCVPLRHGIIIFGYFNLVSSLLVLSLEAWMNWGDSASSTTMGMFRGASMLTQMWLPIVLYSLDVIFSVVLIVGAHLKMTPLLRAFYYYGITTTLAALVSVIVVRSLEWSSVERTRGSGFYVVDLSATFCAFVFHIYLLLLIRSELSKPRYQIGMAFVNQASEIVTPVPWGEGNNPL